MDKNNSPRQKLLKFVNSGELRYALERHGKVDDAVIDLAVLVIDRYCAPRWRRRRKDHK